MKKTVVTKHMIRVGLVLLHTCLLAACSSFYSSNGDKQYLKSRNGNTVVVPAPLTSENISHFYDLPNGGEKGIVSVAPPR